MKSKPCKNNLIPLKTGKVCKASLRGRPPRAFTLIEILVAVTIIVTILSMVYGSYFATAKSADACKVRMILSNQTRKVLSQMARQIRCSYIGKVNENTNLDGSNRINKSPVVYFSCEPDALGNGILYLVTTCRLFCEDGYADGLFDVTYKFDKNSGTLYLSQRAFIGTIEKRIKERKWRPILVNVESVELNFFDGQQWSGKWDFEKERNLPTAVKIGIVCKDKNYRQCHYSTIAYVDCSKSKGRKSPSEISGS